MENIKYKRNMAEELPKIFRVMLEVLKELLRREKVPPGYGKLLLANILGASSLIEMYFASRGFPDRMELFCQLLLTFQLRLALEESMLKPFLGEGASSLSYDRVFQLLEPFYRECRDLFFK